MDRPRYQTIDTYRLYYGARLIASTDNAHVALSWDRTDLNARWCKPRQCTFEVACVGCHNHYSIVPARERVQQEHERRQRAIAYREELAAFAAAMHGNGSWDALEAFAPA